MGEEEREVATMPIAVPADMAEQVAGYDWMRDLVGEAGAEVYRLHARGRPTLYLKHGREAVAQDLVDEMVRLRWLSRYLPVPRVLHFVATADAAWLLMTALPGRTAYACLADDPDSRMAVVEAIVGYLQRLHALPVAECPFNSEHPLRMADARARIDAGLVDTDDFGDAHDGWTAEAVWGEMVGLLPLKPDPVVTHGDYSLDNILIEGGRVTGCIDVGRVGTADRYQDLAILFDCLGEFDPALQAALFRRYGQEPDARKIRFHLALDEFF